MSSFSAMELEGLKQQIMELLTYKTSALSSCCRNEPDVINGKTSAHSRS